LATNDSYGDRRGILNWKQDQAIEEYRKYRLNSDKMDKDKFIKFRNENNLYDTKRPNNTFAE